MDTKSEPARMRGEFPDGASETPRKYPLAMNMPATQAVDRPKFDAGQLHGALPVSPQSTQPSESHAIAAATGQDSTSAERSTKSLARIVALLANGTRSGGMAKDKRERFLRRVRRRIADIRARRSDGHVAGMWTGAEAIDSPASDPPLGGKCAFCSRSDARAPQERLRIAELEMELASSRRELETSKKKIRSLGEDPIDLQRQRRGPNAPDDARNIVNACEAPAVPAARSTPRREIRATFPCRAADDQFEGVAIVLADIIALMAAEREGAAARGHLATGIDTFHEALAQIDATMQVEPVTRSFDRHSYIGTRDIVGLGRADRLERAGPAQKIVDRIRNGQIRVENCRFDVEVPPCGQISLALAACQDRDTADTPRQFRPTIDEMTARQEIVPGSRVVEHDVENTSNSAVDSPSRIAAVKIFAGLSRRQRAVLDLVIAGQTNKMIAARLGISQRTVETHRAAAMKKSGANSLVELIRLALAAE